MNKIENKYVMIGSRRNCKPFKMSYKIYGNGPNKVLFVMGFQLEGDYWSNIVSKYMNEPEKYTICIFDHCGTGGSGYSYFSSFKELAMDMIELLKYLQWNKTHIIAISSGSAVSWELARLEPDLIKSLNVLSMPGFNLRFKAIRQFLMLPFYSKLYNIKKEEMYSRLLFSDSFLNSPSTTLNKRSNKQHLIPLSNKLYNSRFALKYMSRFSHWICSAYHKIKPIDIKLTERKFPIVKFVGTDDPFLPKPLRNKYIKTIKPNLIYVCNGAGHCIQIEDPERFSQLSMNFIDYSNGYKPDTIDSNEKNQFFVTKFLEYNVGYRIPSSNNPFPLKNLRLISYLPNLIKNFIK
ncbi:hypothetical protein ACTA71_008398 [Dictyostelium dimigraforme]